MSDYKHVMIAIDGSAESVKVLARGMALASSGSRVSVVQVFDTLVGNHAYELTMGDFVAAQRDYEEALAKRTRDLLKKEFPALPADAVHFLRGKPAAEIRRLAHSLHVDLLVIGSHGQSAVKSAVLGSTANAVLHGIHCDVHTVRV